MTKVLKGFLSLALILGLAFPATFGKGGHDTRNLAVDDYFRIHRVSDPQINPDVEEKVKILKKKISESD